MQQRLFPFTAGDMQALPDRVFALQRGLDSIKWYYADGCWSLFFFGDEPVRLRGPVRQ